ncbi:MAG: phosphate signaling complex PhoU family protein [Phycisphaerae bacterium]
MLKQIFQAFARKDVVHDLSAQIGEMIDAAHWMFDRASEALLGKVKVDEISDQLYAKDREINHLEQKIREQIMTHLTVGHEGDLAPCLVLMSLVKDAERIGDYCKNIFEVGKFRAAEFKHQEFAQPLDDIRQKIADLFEPVKQALIHSDAKAAKSLRDTARELSNKCDMIVQQLLRLEGEFPASEAVMYSLLARHYKRVEAHLSNIVIGIISPVPLLDFLKRN